MFSHDFSTQLIKTIGVGIGLVDTATGKVVSFNETFGIWFAEAAPERPVLECLDMLDADDIESIRAGRMVELKTKVKRRTLIIELRGHLADHMGHELLVLEGQNISRLREAEAMLDCYATMVDRRTRDLEREKTQVEKLLLNLMPQSVYEEYRTFGSVTPRLFEPVSVLMLDFVGFTQMAAAADPTVTVSELNDIFTAFDRISEMHGCERIKTVGDCYMAVTGLPHPTTDHMLSAARCAAKMLRYLEHRNHTHQHKWSARIGIASGSVVGSVVGVQKYIYDVFGPAVNCAARLQALSNPMEITVCTTARAELEEEFELKNARAENLRGFGEMRVACLSERAPAIRAA